MGPHPPSPSPPKRPRGLWKGRRAPVSQSGRRSHDACSDGGCSASTSTADSLDTAYDEDADDDRASDSSAKRRRLSGALSDSDTLCHRSPSSRALTPDLPYHASCFPSQSSKYPPYPLFSIFPPTMHVVHDKFASINLSSKSKGKQPTTSDIEDWENLKELFARASEAYDADDLEEALPLLRAVIRECHRFLLAHPDPSAVFASNDSSHGSQSPSALTPTEERLRRDWSPDVLDHGMRSHRLTHSYSHPSKSADPPTAFHAIFGTALFLMGTIVAQDSSTALPDEPSAASTYWLAALDVFETGENLPSVLENASSVPEDWRMCVSWGRTLICLADEKVAHSLRSPTTPKVPLPSPLELRNGMYMYQPPPGTFSPVEPRWPPHSPFHAIAQARPPITRRMSLFSASAHDIMVLAMDQFSRGIFHMPHPHAPVSALHLTLEPPRASPAPGARAGFSRAKELFTIASEVLGVAERMGAPAQREYWAAQADAVFSQMKMEADVGEWRMVVNAARGRCWLIVGEARAEEIEEPLERGEVEVLQTAEAEEAREGLAMAVTFLERAKGTASARPNRNEEDLSPLLAEALLTLANLTADERKREELYARAQTEGGDALALELDPPATALPAAISAIALSARTPTLASAQSVSKSLRRIAVATARADAPPSACAIESSPSFMFATGLRSTFAFGHEGFGQVDPGYDQPMLVDVRKEDNRMDES